MVDVGIVRVGISGWTYSPWRGVFYPKSLRREHELAYAARHFRTIEINGTFYGMQRPEVFASWAEQVTADFVFAVKGPRYVTHMLRLRDAEVPLANFLASGVLRLGEHLGPILWQFPPNFRFQPERIADFLRMLPHDTDQAVELVLLRHKSRRSLPTSRIPQQGQRGNRAARAIVSRRLSVAIEFGTCRSGRSGGHFGSATGGNASRLGSIWFCPS